MMRLELSTDEALFLNKLLGKGHPLFPDDMLRKVNLQKRIAQMLIDYENNRD